MFFYIYIQHKNKGDFVDLLMGWRILNHQIHNHWWTYKYS